MTRPNSIHPFAIEDPDAAPSTRSGLPVVVIGAGPVGLAAAAHLLDRGLEPLVLEAAPRSGPTSPSGGTYACSPPGA
jgi:NADPH-dependent 2,4-dienoyl-CoA reductase/sulfur reductase-like enzyme